MCWFFGKKRKEEKEKLESRLETIERDIGVLAQNYYTLEKMVERHIKDDKDMTEGDEPTWGKC